MSEENMDAPALRQGALIHKSVYVVANRLVCCRCKSIHRATLRAQTASVSHSPPPYVRFVQSFSSLSESRSRNSARAVCPLSRRASRAPRAAPSAVGHGVELSDGGALTCNGCPAARSAQKCMFRL